MKKRTIVPIDCARCRVLRHDSRRHFARITTRNMSLFDQFGEPEIESLCVTITSHHNVVGLQIAMDNPSRMSFRQSFSRVLQITKQLF